MIQRFTINGKKYLFATYSDWRVFQLSKITNQEWQLMEKPKIGIDVKDCKRS